MMPFFSCIVTAYNEGNTAKVALESLLAQSFQDFEVLIVHDGVDKQTEEVLLRYQDPRFIHIPQSNDGLSSARNRAIPHCKGQYICFLDADDLRPNWAFESVYKTATEHDKPDCIFSPGLLVELRNEVLPFYDQAIFDHFLSVGKSFFSETELKEHLAKVLLIEPQSANKFVKKELIDKYKLRYPAGLFFEDMLFHAGVCACMESFAVNRMPTFTYFRRYGRPQITSSAGLNRFDAISMAFITLCYWEKSSRFSNTAASAALLLSLFKLLKWCEDSISHFHRYLYGHAVKQNMTTLGDGWIRIIQSEEMNSLASELPWARSVKDYIDNMVCEFI